MRHRYQLSCCQTDSNWLDSCSSSGTLISASARRHSMSSVPDPAVAKGSPLPVHHTEERDNHLEAYSSASLDPLDCYISCVHVYRICNEVVRILWWLCFVNVCCRHARIIMYILHDLFSYFLYSWLSKSFFNGVRSVIHDPPMSSDLLW